MDELDEFHQMLRTLRTECGLRKAQLARSANVSLSQLEKLESGDRFPSAETAETLDDLLSAGGTLIRSRLADMERRDLLKAGAAIALPIPMVSEPDRAAEDLSTALTHLRLAESTAGSQLLIPAVQGLRATTRSSIGRRASTSMVDLHAQACEYLGWLYLAPGDLPDTFYAASGPKNNGAVPKVAWRLLYESRAAADQAGSRVRAALTYHYIAYAHAIFAHDYSAALAAAHTGLGVRADNSVTTNLTYQVAEYHARAGESKQARTWLAKADRLVDAYPHDTSTYWHSPSYWEGNHAWVRFFLGDLKAAEESARRSYASYPSEFRTSEWCRYRRALAEGRIPASSTFET